MSINRRRLLGTSGAWFSALALPIAFRKDGTHLSPDLSQQAVDILLNTYAVPDKINGSVVGDTNL